MNKNLKIEAGVIMLFVLLTLIQFYPLSLHPAHAANDLKDALLNAWIVSWVQGALFSQPGKLFDTNTFYPYPNTLSYSEHLFPLAVLSLPVALVVANPVLTANVLLLAFFVLNAYAMYLLVKNLTGNRWAGILCGLVFAFNTYQMQHLAHLQLTSSWCIPLAFLYLHKYFKSRTWRDSSLFALFFMIQALSAVYYGLFFVSVLIVVLPVLSLLYARPIKASFVIKLVTPLAVSALILFYFSLPYMSLFKTFDFQRGLGPGADLMNYLAVRSQQLILGDFLNSLGRHEHYLFAGLFALIMAPLFLIKKIRLLHLIPKVPRYFLLALTGVGGLGYLILVITGGFRLTIGNLVISGHRLHKYAIPFFLGAICLLIVSFIFFLKKKKVEPEKNDIFFIYIFLVVWSLLLSFGSTVTLFGTPVIKGKGFGLLLTPFRWFYTVGLGFKGIRVPSRYGIFVIFGLTVIAGFGFAALWDHLKKKKTRTVLACLLLVLMNIEYLEAPKSFEYVPTGKNIPPSYSELKKMPGDFAVAELPFLDPISKDALYMYLSLYHGKKIVNGYSGFIPPEIFYTRAVFDDFPNWECFDILKTLGIRYVLVHWNAFKLERRIRIRYQLEHVFHEDLKEVRSFCYPVSPDLQTLELFGDDTLYEVTGPPIERPYVGGGQDISYDQWCIASDLNEKLLPLLRDNQMETKWETPGPKRFGNALHITFPNPQRVTQVLLYLPPRDADTQFAVRLVIRTSKNGRQWRLSDGAYAAGEFSRDLVLDPKHPVQKIYLDGKPIRYLRIVQNGRETHAPWSIAEMKIIAKTSTATESRPLKKRPGRRRGIRPS